MTKPSSNLHEAAYFKLSIAAHVMRALTAAFTVLTLWQTLVWWSRIDRIVFMNGRFWQVDLNDIAAWQPWVGFSVGLLAWVCLLVSVVYAWMFLADFTQHRGLTQLGGERLMRCAWWALACLTCNVLARPIFSYFLTIQLEPALRVIDWQWHLRDLMRGILVLALLMFAYVYSWLLEMSEENKGFV